jgi:uncharacterized protein YaiL (DUF2058 family)
MNVSSSIRDQLLKAGLVTEKQVRQAAQQEQRPQSRHKPAPPSAQKVGAQQAQAAKAARDQELNRQRQLNAEAKARSDQIKQLIEQHRLPKVESDDRFNFIAGKKIRSIAVNPAMRDGLNRGELAIVRYGGHSDVVPAAIADRIRERDERAVVPLSTTKAPVDDNDPYKEFVVPDDLKW